MAALSAAADPDYVICSSAVRRQVLPEPAAFSARRRLAAAAHFPPCTKSAPPQWCSGVLGEAGAIGGGIGAEVPLEGTPHGLLITIDKLQLTIRSARRFGLEPSDELAEVRKAADGLVRALLVGSIVAQQLPQSER